MNRNFISYGLLALAQLMVGINIVGSKAIVEDLSIVSILFWRFFIATIVLLIIHHCVTPRKIKVNAVLMRELTRYDWAYMTAQALCGGVLFNLMLLWGLNYTSASVAGIITSVLPALIAILSILFLSERLSLFSGLCISFAVIGLLIINASNFRQANFDNLTGDFLILLALLPEAGYYVLAKVYVNKLPLFLTAALMNALNLPFVLIALIWSGSLFGQFSVATVIILLVLGLSTGFFYVFWFAGCKLVKSSIAGMFTAVMPIATLLIAWLALEERISLLQLLGMLMVIMSIFFNARKS